MGEAKRRKKLDPNFGTGIGSKTKPKLYEYLMGDIGRRCYTQHGRGVLFNLPGFAPRYVLPSCSWLKSVERDLIHNYDPETEVVMAELNLEDKLSSSRIVEKMTIELANQLRIKSTWESIEEVVNNMFVATAENEPK